MNKGAFFGRVFEPPVGAAFLYGIEHNMNMIITKYSEQINMLCKRDTNIGRVFLAKAEKLKYVNFLAG